MTCVDSITFIGLFTLSPRLFLLRWQSCGLSWPSWSGGETEQVQRSRRGQVKTENWLKILRKIFRTSWILTWRLSGMEILGLKLTDWLKMSRKVNVFSENYQGWSITCVHILPWFHFQGLARKREIAKTLSPTPTPSSMSGCFGSKWLTQYFSSSVFGHKHLSTMLTKIVSQHSVHKCLIIDRPRAGVSQ